MFPASALIVPAHELGRALASLGSEEAAMIQGHLLVGRIAGLRVFRVPEFGTRASFRLQCLRECPVTCSVAGALARELVTFYCEGDMVAVSGFTNHGRQRLLR